MRIAPIFNARFNVNKPAAVSKTKNNNVSFGARNSDFFSSIDEYSVTLHGNRYIPVHPDANADAKQLRHFASCVWDFDDDTIKNVLCSSYHVRCEDGDITRVCSAPKKNREKMHKFYTAVAPHIEDVRKEVYQNSPAVAQLGETSVLSKQELISAKKHLYYSFFNTLKASNEGKIHHGNIPRGIILTGSSKENIEEIKQWLKTYGAKEPLNVNYIKVDLDNNLKVNYDKLKMAMSDAKDNHNNKGKYTIIELENYADLLKKASHQENNKDFMIFQAKLKSFLEEGSSCFATLLAVFPNNDFEALPQNMKRYTRFQTIVDCGRQGLSKENDKKYQRAKEITTPHILNIGEYEKKYLCPWEGSELQIACKSATEIYKREPSSIFSRMARGVNGFFSNSDKPDPLNESMKDLLGEFWYEDY